MGCSTFLFSLFLVSPCTDNGGPDIAKAVAAAVADPGRPTEDRAKDAARKPAEVLSFFNIKPGMTVLDLFSGSGYYSEMLNSLVGHSGRVIAHTNEAYIPYVGEIYETRYTGGRLAQTETIIAEADELQLEANSLDAAMLVLTWHDFLYADLENGWNAVDESRLLGKLCEAMKPGAVLGLIDHVAAPGGDPIDIAKSLHRVDPQQVLNAFDKSCFTLGAEAGILRNAEDDLSLPVFAESVRGNTDRFVFRFIRK